jgi:hypothetical protein
METLWPMEQTQQPQYPAVANGTFTLIWPDGRHKTFAIKTMESAEKQKARGKAPFAPGKRVISLMTGADNETSYTKFGFVYDNRISIWPSIRAAVKPQARRVWNEGKIEDQVKLFWYLATLGEKSRFYAAGYRLEASKRCVVCNRKLTNPQSLETNIGPECAMRRGL